MIDLSVETLRLHKRPGGKYNIAPKVGIREMKDLWLQYPSRFAGILLVKDCVINVDGVKNCVIKAIRLVGASIVVVVEGSLIDRVYSCN